MPALRPRRPAEASGSDPHCSEAPRTYACAQVHLAQFLEPNLTGYVVHSSTTPQSTSQSESSITTSRLQRPTYKHQPKVKCCPVFIWPNPQILCQDLVRLNLPVPVSTPEEFAEKGLGNTAWQARLYYLLNDGKRLGACGKRLRVALHSRSGILWKGGLGENQRLKSGMLRFYCFWPGRGAYFSKK